MEQQHFIHSTSYNVGALVVSVYLEIFYSNDSVVEPDGSVFLAVVDAFPLQPVILTNAFHI